ncbi:thioesterase family protein [Salegentibacter sp. F188]|uniref:Thioesterase family protein n=1 Tax=Autumnicola patrickiae TaxID=3075591 RepID=A0ABU3DX87_9FLAO|nr:thioesterase family protein [Salegentibacter sp. F188]MDT0688300.1 thioesterase family protein [Salegentibacter sp. F188]
MKSHITHVKVRYAETDQMGVVHHGNYAQYLEIARIDWLKELDISYKSMETNGIMMPVYEISFKFLKPATFDENLKIETRLKEKPGVKIAFDYSIFNEREELITTANTVLVFMDSETRRPVKCPENILKKLGF